MRAVPERGKALAAASAQNMRDFVTRAATVSVIVVSIVCLFVFYDGGAAPSTPDAKPVAIWRPAAPKARRGPIPTRRRHVTNPPAPTAEDAPPPPPPLPPVPDEEAAYKLVLAKFDREMRARHAPAATPPHGNATREAARIVADAPSAAVAWPFDTPSEGADVPPAAAELLLSRDLCPARTRFAYDPLDRPRFRDEEWFCHLAAPSVPDADPRPRPTAAGAAESEDVVDDDDADDAAGIAADSARLRAPPTSQAALDAALDELTAGASAALSAADRAMLLATMTRLHRMFAAYDYATSSLFAAPPRGRFPRPAFVADDPHPQNANVSTRISTEARDAVPVFGTMCVGVDCGFIPDQIAHLRVGVGHFIVVVSTGEWRWVAFFTALERQFPGRFSKFVRPWTLGCAESWNLIARMAFAIDPPPPYVFLANADWWPRPTPRAPNSMQAFARWTAPLAASKIAIYYYGHAAFAFTRLAYHAVGYFDESLWPAYYEDVEFHMRAISRGYGDARKGYDGGIESVGHRGSHSLKSPTVASWTARAAGNDYVKRKWGVDFDALVRGGGELSGKTPVFAAPFNISLLRHNASWAVDPAHRRCIRTGEGAKLAGSGRCFYNATALRAAGMLPPHFRFAPALLRP